MSVSLRSFFRAIFLLTLFQDHVGARPGLTEYVVDGGPGLGRTFDGIGAISGGGATSKLLRNYNASIRDQILDYLFKPNFGASLHILKVEIGGDSQSTDGVEASHMHTAFDENYSRGYEWWLMAQAIQRNPSIKLYGLPWVFPGWLGGGVFNPYTNRSALVHYMVSWVKGAFDKHHLLIDYVGIWNERAYDTIYIKMLRAGLNDAGFSHTQVVVADSSEWKIVADLHEDEDLLRAVGPIGIHYPGTESNLEAYRLGHPLWASEEYSDFNDLSGGGCWARVLCESYVNGYFTAVIAWNLVTSYYDNLPYPRSSMMVANQPWSGHYEVNSPIWISSHFTQFSWPGWRYLRHGFGVGTLALNGSYVALASPDMDYLTIIVETIDSATSPCFYKMPEYAVSAQTATFKLQGTFANITELRAWRSYLDFTHNKTELFIEQPVVKVKDGRFSVVLPVNTLYTFTTLPPNVGQKGSHPMPPPPAPFPTTYSEDFEGYPVGSEAYNLAQQAGSFEISEDAGDMHGKVLVQSVPQPPVDTCRPERMTRPIVVFGNFNWSDVTVQYDFLLEHCPMCASGVFLAARVDIGGCYAMYSNGFYAWISGTKQTLTLSANHTRSKIYMELPVNISVGYWHTLALSVKDTLVSVSLDKATLIRMYIPDPPSAKGFVAFGTEEFGKASFDNLKVNYAKQAAKPTKLENKLSQINEIKKLLSKLEKWENVGKRA